MSTKVSDLTVDDLKTLIAGAVTETMEDFVEDLEAMRSGEFIRSIEKAREEYRLGDVKTMEQVFGVLPND